MTGYSDESYSVVAVTPKVLIQEILIVNLMKRL